MRIPNTFTPIYILCALNSLNAYTTEPVLSVENETVDSYEPEPEPVFETVDETVESYEPEPVFETVDETVEDCYEPEPEPVFETVDETVESYYEPEEQVFETVDETVESYYEPEDEQVFENDQVPTTVETPCETDPTFSVVDDTIDETYGTDETYSSEDPPPQFSTMSGGKDVVVGMLFVFVVVLLV
jgi:hypothetical protein